MNYQLKYIETLEKKLESADKTGADLNDKLKKEI